MHGTKLKYIIFSNGNRLQSSILYIDIICEKHQYDHILMEKLLLKDILRGILSLFCLYAFSNFSSHNEWSWSSKSDTSGLCNMICKHHLKLWIINKTLRCNWLFIQIYSFTWKTELRKEWKRERVLPFPGLPPIWLLHLEQFETGSHISHMGVGAQGFRSCFTASSGTAAENWIKYGADRT